MNACSRDASAASSSAEACSSVRDCDGRPSPPARRIHQRRHVPADQILPLRVPNRPGQAVMALLQRPGRMRRRHLLQRTTHVLHGQVLQRDPPDDRQQRPQRVPVRLDRLSSPPRQSLVQPVGHGLVDRVPLSRPQPGVQFGVQRLELVFDLGLGLAADLPAQTFPVRVEPQRDHASPAPSTGLMKSAVPAVAPVIEVDAVFAVATARSPSHTESLRLGSRIGSPTKSQKIEQATWPGRTRWS
jgi:hypothetical protein